MPISYFDPIHQQISISDRHHELIRSAPIARLRNIKQLGLTLSKYSGAVHTRFEHTLGTAHILANLTKQFGVSNEQERERYVQSALLSEIGIYPLSYSSRAVFDDGPTAKADFKQLVYVAYLEGLLGADWEEEAEFCHADAPAHQWFRSIPGVDEFPGLTPIKLASTIDYVLRDAYYSGRYTGNFDYRFFSTVRRDDDYDTRREILGSVRELHRAAHALNSIYGDRTRRFLTAVLARLAARLASSKLLDVQAMKQVGSFVDLDDDVFFSEIGLAVEHSQDAGDDLSARMFQVVSQTQTVNVRFLDLEEADTAPTKHELEAQIAKAASVSPDAVFCLGDKLQDGIGFRLFGREFPSYSEAVSSEYFREMTGLAIADDRTGLERPGTVPYIIV